MNPWKKNRLDSPCKFWLDGYCPRSAEECEFAHAGTVVKVPKLCKFYMDSRCVKAKACAFLHETYPCADFVVGRCQLGSDCKLSHAPLDDESTAMVKEDLVTKQTHMMEDLAEETDVEEKEKQLAALKHFRAAATEAGIDLGAKVDDEALQKLMIVKKNDSVGQEVDFSCYEGPYGGPSNYRYALHGTSGNFRYARANMAKFEAYEEMERRILSLYNEISIERYEALSLHLRILD